MSHLESIALTSTSMGVPPPTSTAHRRWTSLIAQPSSPAKSERPSARSPLSKAQALHRRSLSLNLSFTTHTTRNRFPAPRSAYPALTCSPTAAFAVRSRSHLMLAKINTSVHPDRPTRRPHGPRSAISPPVSSTKSATRTHYHDIWKARAGPSTIRTSPPQTSLP